MLRNRAIEIGFTQLNGQLPVVWRFIAAGHLYQRLVNQAITAELPSGSLSGTTLVVPDGRT
jgi:hypothetical protein